jgi:hypothetical protein
MLFDSSGMTRAASTTSAGPAAARRQAPWALLNRPGLSPHPHVAARAGEVLAQQALAAALDRDEHDALRELERLLEAQAQALGCVGAQHQAVHQHVDAVPAPRVELELVPEVRRLPVDARALQPGLAGGLELLAVGPLAAAGDGRGDHRDGAGRLLEEPSGHLVRALRRIGSRRAGSEAARASRTARAGGRRSR